MRIAAAFLLLALSAPASAQESPAGSCCLLPQEVVPLPPRRRASCKGNLWSAVSAARCVPGGGEPGTTCRAAGLTTMVQVREFQRYWDERQKICVVASTGRVNLVPVSVCDGDPC